MNDQLSNISKTHSGSEKKVSDKNSKSLKFILQIAKWGVVVWLLYPLYNPVHGMRDFVQVTVGMFLFVIFTFQLLYREIIEGRHRKRDPKSELLHLVGITLVIAGIVAVVIFVIGMYVMQVGQMLTSPE